MVVPSRNAPAAETYHSRTHGAIGAARSRLQRGSGTWDPLFGVSVNKIFTGVIPPGTRLFASAAARVPVPDGSVVDLFAELEKEVTVEDVHEAIKSAAESKRMKGILQFVDSPVVSSDVIGNSHSSIFDPAFTAVTGGKYLKCLSWYDNEWGYSNRVCDLLGLIARWG